MNDVVISICSENDLEILQAAEFTGAIHIGAPLIKNGELLETDKVTRLLSAAKAADYDTIIVDLPLVLDISSDTAIDRIRHLLDNGASYVCIEYLPDRDELWQGISVFSSQILVQLGYVAQSINMKNPLVLEGLDSGFVQKSTKAMEYLSHGLLKLIALGYSNYLFEAISNNLFTELLSNVSGETFFTASVGIRVSDINISKLNAVCLVLEDILTCDNMASIPKRPEGMSDAEVVQRIVKYTNEGKYRDLFDENEAALTSPRS